MKSGWEACDAAGIEIDDKTREMTLENAIKFVKLYGLNATTNFQSGFDGRLYLFGNEALRVIEKALLWDGYTLHKDWIPCSERFPEEGMRIIVQYGDGSLGVIERVRLKIWNLINSPYAKVVAWMPAPEPYKKGEEDVI